MGCFVLTISAKTTFKRLFTMIFPIFRSCLYTSMLFSSSCSGKSQRNKKNVGSSSRQRHLRERAEKQPGRKLVPYKKMPCLLHPPKKMILCSIKPRGASTGGPPPSGCNHQPPFYIFFFSSAYLRVRLAGAERRRPLSQTGATERAEARPSPAATPSVVHHANDRRHNNEHMYN